MKTPLTKYAKDLRREMTKAERLLWSKLNGQQLGFKFKRQHPIGHYIVDFVCTRQNLVIEVDGGQHCENKEDIKRDLYLNSCGYKVLRFWNNEVLGNIEGVVEKIGTILLESDK